MTLKIHGKIVLLVGIVLLAALGINTLISTFQFRESYTHVLQTKVAVVGEDLREAVMSSLALGFELDKLIGVNDMCRKIITRYNEIDYCYIINHKNNVLYHNNHSYAGKLLREEPGADKLLDKDITIMTSFFEGKEFYNIILQIKDENTKLGEIRLGLPFKIIRMETAKMVKSSILLTIVSFILAIMLSVYLSKNITFPIKLLTEGAGAISEGNLDYHINIKSKDETGQLASAFNQMTNDLKMSMVKLEKYSKELEKKVKERTKELEDKNMELEKFNKLAVGRELKMIELKKRINELDDELRKVKKR
ncbi:MAG: HAMP domain-containing protein [Nanoarchaeota archaeon]|nr:HAMP domain-containing protein [Nanoarchaeota archaeon]